MDKKSQDNSAVVNSELPEGVKVTTRDGGIVHFNPFGKNGEFNEAIFIPTKTGKSFIVDDSKAD